MRRASRGAPPPAQGCPRHALRHCAGMDGGAAARASGGSSRPPLPHYPPADRRPRRRRAREPRKPADSAGCTTRSDGGSSQALLQKLTGTRNSRTRHRVSVVGCG